MKNKIYFVIFSFLTIIGPIFIGFNIRNLMLNQEINNFLFLLFWIIITLFNIVLVYNKLVTFISEYVIMGLMDEFIFIQKNEIKNLLKNKEEDFIKEQ